MIVAATFSGHIGRRRLFWSLDASGDDATVDARWTPPDGDRNSAAVSFKLPRSDFEPLLAVFASLAPRYPSSLDGAAIRNLSVSSAGVTSTCTVHGSPSLAEFPELEHFYAIWRPVERLVHTEIEWHRGG